MREFIDIAKGLSDSGRVRVLLALKGRELCVSQIAELLELATSTVSKHMAVLRRAYLVDFRKDGSWAYYRRSGRDAPQRVQAAFRWLDSSIADWRVAHKDEARLKKILEIPVEELRKNLGR